MDTERYCAYNTTRDCFLGSEVTLIDNALDPLGVLRVLVEGLAEGTQAGLWLTPLTSIPMVPRISPFDIVYLDKNHQVTQAAELLPGVEFPVFEGPSESALVLPLHTISSTQTRRGDSLRVYIDRDMGSKRSAARPSVSDNLPVPKFLGRHNSNGEQRKEIAVGESVGQASANSDQLDLFVLERVAGSESRSAGSSLPRQTARVGIDESGSAGIARRQAVPPSAIDRRVEHVEQAITSSHATSEDAESDGVPAYTGTPVELARERSGATNGAKHSGNGTAPSTEKNDSEFTVSNSRTWRTSAPTAVAQVAQGATLPEVLIPLTAVNTASTNRAITLPESNLCPAPGIDQTVSNTRWLSSSGSLAKSGVPAEEPSPADAFLAASAQNEKPRSAAIRAIPAPPEPRVMKFNGSPSVAHCDTQSQLRGHEPEPGAIFPTRESDESAQSPNSAGSAEGMTALHEVRPRADEPSAEIICGQSQFAQRSDQAQVPSHGTNGRAQAKQTSTTKQKLETRILGWLKHAHFAVPPIAEVASGISRAATRESLKAQLRRWLEPEVPPQDRRSSSRRQVPSLVAYYWTGGAPKAHRVADISECGFYMVTDDRWVADTMIQMTLQKRGNNGQRKVSMSVLAKVVRSGRDGVGAAFVMSESLDLHSREMLGARGTDRRTLSRFLQ